MSEDQLYEVARQRIDRRNRRRKLWILDLGVLIFTLALVAVTEGATAALFLAWAGVFTVHTLLLTTTNSRDRDIEREVARLRSAVYEKPKRLELDEDGELVEFEDDLDSPHDKRKRDSV